MEFFMYMALAVMIAVTWAEREPSNHFPHVHPRQYYSPPPSYSPPVPSSTFDDDLPPFTSGFLSTGIPSSATPPIVVSSTVTLPIPSSPTSSSTRPAMTTSCALTDEGIIWCSEISPSSRPSPTTGTFTDGTATSFPVDTPTWSFGPPISFSQSSDSTLSTRVTGPPASYLSSTTAPYSNGTSSPYTWGTGTVSSTWSTLTAPSSTISSGYFVPVASSSSPSWDVSSSSGSETLTAPTDMSTATWFGPSSSSKYTYTYTYTYTHSYPSYSYSYSSYTPSPSDDTTTTTIPLTSTSNPFYYPSTSIPSIPSIPSTISWEFPPGFSFSIPTESPSTQTWPSILPPSPSSYFSSTRSTRPTPTQSFSSVSFPSWPPWSGYSSSTRTTSTLSDATPTSFMSSTTQSGYDSPLPTEHVSLPSDESSLPTDDVSLPTDVAKTEKRGRRARRQRMSPMPMPWMNEDGVAKMNNAVADKEKREGKDSVSVVGQ